MPDAPPPSLAPLALTMGDPAGIGPEIILLAASRDPLGLRDCVVYGDWDAMQRAAKVVQDSGRPVPLLERWHEGQDRSGWPTGVLALRPVAREKEGTDLPPWGQVDARAGRWAADAVRAAAQAALAGRVRGLVTAPLHKEALALAGEPFPGHTELLQACAAKHAGCSVADVPVRMMLASPALRTVLVSIHVSLRQAVESVTTEAVLETLRITHTAEQTQTGRTPRIAVAGLNPHAGEGGLMGREEIDAIAPAIALARAEGIDASGPWSPDTVFMRARHQANRAGEFDVVVAMYHDQGLIPIKYLGLDEGVNVTLGLPFVRTSPDHGTAFDQAGRATADPASWLAALAWARRASQSPSALA